MTSLGASPTLADRLVAACYDGDLPAAKAAVSDGASVNEKGTAPNAGWGVYLPLVAALAGKHHDVVVWLLSHGADPNGGAVVYCGTYDSTAAMLQLLIDAGGDVNLASDDSPPLFSAVAGYNGEANVRLLLAQPSLDFTIKFVSTTPEQYARDCRRPVLGAMIAQEVSANGTRFCIESDSLTVCGVAVVDRSRDERRWYDNSLFV